MIPITIKVPNTTVNIIHQVLSGPNKQTEFPKSVPVHDPDTIPIFLIELKFGIKPWYWFMFVKSGWKVEKTMPGSFDTWIKDKLLLQIFTVKYDLTSGCSANCREYVCVETVDPLFGFICNNNNSNKLEELVWIENVWYVFPDCQKLIAEEPVEFPGVIS